MKFQHNRLGAAIIALLLVAVMLTGCSPAAEQNAGPQKKAEHAALLKDAVPMTDSDVITNGNLSLSVDTSTGFITVKDKAANMTYCSNPIDYESDPLAQGVNITRTISQILVTYLNDKKAIDEVNSYVGSVSEGSFNMMRNGNNLLVNYTFKEQGFFIPLCYTLEEDRLVVSIDYDRIKERGKSRILNITLLPFFGAAGRYDEGFTIFPDGSGSYIGYNNGRFAQGSYSREIYNGDLTNISRTKPNSYRPVLLPMFASIHTGVVDPVVPEVSESEDDWMGSDESEEEKEPEVKPEPRDVQAGFVASILTGDAGSKITTIVAGGELSYNTTYFEFLYRSYMQTSFLSRTWAEIIRTLFHEGQAHDENPSVVYEFLQGDEASISGAAKVGQKLIFGDREAADQVQDKMYLDVVASVRTKQQTLGVGYQDITPLTTLEEVKAICDELSKKEIGKLAVQLRGIDDSGAFFGKIDSKFSIDGKVGSKKELLQLMEAYDVYPQVTLTEFSRGGNGYGSFFDGATAVNHKSVKRYSYNYATGLRDYDLPTRYLLQPDKVGEAVEKLVKDLDKKEIDKLAPTSLGTDLYSDFSNEAYQIGTAKNSFAKNMQALAKGRDLMLEAPNAYAISSATALIHLPGSDSGHFISDGAVPFLQLICDGMVSYSTPSLNKAADAKRLELFAIESNSSLAYTVIAADYDKVRRTSLNDLYSADYDMWKDTIIESGRKLSELRDQTEHSLIVDYQLLTGEVRKVTFANGTVLLINHGAKKAKADGVTIDAYSYLVKEEVSQ